METDEKHVKEKKMSYMLGYRYFHGSNDEY